MFLTKGTFLQDRYEILERIGIGGMSIVYKAHCHKLNRPVAIKVLKEEFCEDENFVAKFKMEAQSAAGLSHPNIVNVYDVVDDRELHYIVMEYIEGITLKTYIQKKGKLGIKESIGISLQVAKGIKVAHDADIIHRDIKPQNIIITKDGNVKVADFGIARAISEQTLSANAIGSVHYISPEQARGAICDKRSDIYSLGITMYEMTTGKLPFDGDNTVSIALAHIEERIVPPSTYNKDIPESLEKVILICTQKNPDRRYRDLENLISDLTKILLNIENDIKEDDDGYEEDDLYKTKIISDTDISAIKEAKIKDGNIKEPKEDTNKGMDRLISILGALTAFIIAALIGYFIIRYSGFFSPKRNEETAIESTLTQSMIYAPDIVGLDEDLAEALLKENSLQIKILNSEYNDNIEKGKIISQNPKAGESVSKFSNIEAVVSLGSNKIDLSTLGLEKLDKDMVRQTLENNGLSVETVEEFSENIEAGKIIKYEPQKPEKGSRVTVYVSKGVEQKKATVPNLVGLSEDDALAVLAEARLSAGDISEAYSDTHAKGKVSSQGTAVGTEVNEGEKISFKLSLGKEPEEKNYSYIASINSTYNIANLIGPGSETTEVSIMIRLKQTVNGEDKYKTLMEPRTVTGNTILPVRFTSIKGEYGIEKGQLEIVEANSGAVLKTYDLEFFKVE